MTKPQPIVSEKTQTLEEEFAADVRDRFSPLQSEIAARNKRIRENDSYIYGDLLEHMLEIPIGHDFTPINWLRRTVEIHRAQFMGKGFSVDSSYQAVDINSAGEDDTERQRLKIENDKKKSYAEIRRQLTQAIIKDNGGDAFWAAAAENASAVGDAVVKAWFNEEKQQYVLQLIETLDNVYALWSKDNYRDYDAIAYVYQINKKSAIARYGVPQDVPTSPLGTPLAVLSVSNMVQYISTQPMVTIMEVTGKVEGWKTDGKGNLQRCLVGQETELNAIIVGNKVYQLLDDPKMLPKYYILPNKRVRRRPWGVPDITHAAIQINLTFIETLSDWRTVASKVNFPKFKAFGFPPGVQAPKPKARTVEFLPLAAGQDIQPITMGQSGQMAEADFVRQLETLENQFVREVGVSRQLFDMPDNNPGNSNPATITSMKSVSDITNAKRELWTPIISKIFEDALKTVAEYDDAVKEVVTGDDNWTIKINFPSSLNQDDPSFHAMKLNQFNTNLLSIQSFLEDTGYDKQELDRIREEMEDPVTAAIHAHTLATVAESKLPPAGPPAPKVNINLRGDMSPEQEANLANSDPRIANGPFPITTSPQGNSGLTATDNLLNQGDIVGNKPTGGLPVNHPAPEQSTQPGAQSPELINGGAAAQPGVGIMSQPGSGAPMTTATGKMKQMQQRRGK